MPPTPTALAELEARVTTLEELVLELRSHVTELERTRARKRTWTT
jgi:uncharacterized coiled-coil protein SlyX